MGARGCPTVTVVVAGTPTVRVILRWTPIWFPDTIIFHPPDRIAEKGMPLPMAVLAWPRVPVRGGVLPCRRDLLAGRGRVDARAHVLVSIGVRQDGVDGLGGAACARTSVPPGPTRDGVRRVRTLEDGDEAKVLV